MITTVDPVAAELVDSLAHPGNVAWLHQQSRYAVLNIGLGTGGARGDNCLRKAHGMEDTAVTAGMGDGLEGYDVELRFVQVIL